MKKHILIFIPSIESGGVEKNAIMVANGLVAQGFWVSVLYCRMMEEKRACFFEQVELVKMQRKQIPGLNPRLTDAYFMKKSLAEYLKKEDANMTTLIAFQSASAVIGLCKKYGIRVICRLSNHPSAIKHEKSLVRHLSEWLKPFTYQKADVVVANSKRLEQDFSKKIKKEVLTIYNPIELEQIREMQKETIEFELEKEAVEHRNKLLIAIGRLTKQKDYATLLRGLAKTTDTQIKLWIIGEGAERAHIEQLIVELGLSERVRLLGYRNNVYKYLKYGTIYVLSSVYEGCPNSLIEAVAMGIPCISSNCLTGPEEVLLDGKAGLLFTVGDSDELAKKIDFYIQNPKIREEMNLVAMNSVERFSIHKTIEAYKEII